MRLGESQINSSAKCCRAGMRHFNPLMSIFFLSCFFRSLLWMFTSLLTSQRNWELRWVESFPKVWIWSVPNRNANPRARLIRMCSFRPLPVKSSRWRTFSLSVPSAPCVTFWFRFGNERANGPTWGWSCHHLVASCIFSQVRFVPPSLHCRWNHCRAGQFCAMWSSLWFMRVVVTIIESKHGRSYRQIQSQKREQQMLCRYWMKQVPISQIRKWIVSHAEFAQWRLPSIGITVCMMQQQSRW